MMDEKYYFKLDEIDSNCDDFEEVFSDIPVRADRISVLHELAKIEASTSMIRFLLSRVEKSNDSD